VGVVTWQLLVALSLVAAVLASAVLAFAAFRMGYTTAQLRFLERWDRLSDAWQFDLDTCPFPENIHRSKAYANASQIWIDTASLPLVKTESRP
jgi:hypothetical protein